MAKSSVKVVIAALIANTLVIITKFVAAALTGSSAMLAEGVHSTVDTTNELLMLHGLRRARTPADENFPFGYGKEVYFWCFVVATLIFAAGSGVSLFEGVDSLLNPQPIENPWINYVVLGLAMLFEGASWLFALTEFTRTKGKWGYIEAVQRGKDPSMFIVLFEDSAALLGLVVAFAGIALTQLTGMPRFDGAASVIIGLLLGGTASWLAYETKGLLIGESANKPVVDDIRRIAADFENIDRVNEVLTMHMGPDFILVNLSVKFADGTEAAEIESTIARLDRSIKEIHPSARRVFVEAERYASQGITTASTEAGSES